MMQSLKITEEEKTEVHVPLRDIDQVTDVSDDEPWTPIPGTTKMACGKYSKSKLTFEDINRADKSYLRWVRGHITIASAEGMIKLRWQGEMREKPVG